MNTLVQVMNIANLVLLVLFCLCYSYQFYYAFVAHLCRPRIQKGEGLHRLAVLVSARNEEKVLPYLLECLAAQDYPKELYSVFVVADNCRDRTAQVARSFGATVFERQDADRVGKGYAIDYLLSEMDRTVGADAFDAYVVFDADNLVEPSFLREICRVFDGGAEIVAGYRNAKNYADSWVSAGQGMWFIREASTLNAARVGLGQGAVVAGTGFLFSRKIKELHGGWPFYMLTEDTQFMVASHLAGYNAAYAPDAEFFDEQPTSFLTSFKQRMRWCKGGIQVFLRYARPLAKRALHGDRTSMELLVSMAPAYVLMTVTFVLNLILGTAVAVGGRFADVLPILAIMLGALSVFVIVFSSITTFSQWKKIHASTAKKLLYIFTFPLFMLSFVPICLCAMLFPVQWNPIPRTALFDLEHLKQKKRKK